MGLWWLRLLLRRLLPLCGLPLRRLLRFSFQLRLPLSLLQLFLLRLLLRLLALKLLLLRWWLQPWWLFSSLQRLLLLAARFSRRRRCLLKPRLPLLWRRLLRLRWRRLQALLRLRPGWRPRAAKALRSAWPAAKLPFRRRRWRRPRLWPLVALKRLSSSVLWP